MTYKDFLVLPNSNLIDADKVEFRCKCGAIGIKSVGHAKRSLKDKGFAYQCKECLAQKINASRVVEYSQDYLTEARAVDTTARRIQTSETVEFFCACGEKGSRKFADAVKAKERHGFFFQCKACFNQKIKNRSNNEEWLRGIRVASQSDAHKERARQNGKKRLALKQLHNIADYFDFSVDIQNVAGTDEVTATCKTCKNTVTKPLKKLIESIDNQAHGCQYCWNNIITSPEYAIIMGARSTPAGTKSRIAQSETNKENWKNLPEAEKKRRGEDFFGAYQVWAAANPDKLFSSKAELEILSWVRSLGLEANKHRHGGKELDIYIPEKHIGIEYNGLYWHCEKNKDQKYHQDKTKYFKDQGIRVIHVFEHIWRDKQPQVKSFLRAALGKNENRVGARQCEIKQITTEEASFFANLYHIQGAAVSNKLSVGLFYDEQLVAVATFGRHHRKSEVVVLNRFIGKNNWSVIGGLSRIMKFALNHFKKDIITWADNSISEGIGYLKAGWTIEEELPVDYFYTDFTNVCSKQSRKKGVVGTPENITEHEHALHDGLFRIFDCGKTRMIFRYVLIEN